MKIYDVTIPVAGHAVVRVQAESEKDAIDKALLGEITLDDIEDWDALRRFNQGNVCHCPLPWDAEANLAFGEEEDEDAA